MASAASAAALGPSVSAAIAAAAAAAAANAGGRNVVSTGERSASNIPNHIGGHVGVNGARPVAELPPTSSAMAMAATMAKLPFLQQQQQQQQQQQAAMEQAKNIISKGREMAPGQQMPLSPPLTPLPPSIPRFPHNPMIASSPYHAANLQSLLLAAQYHPLLAARGVQFPPPTPNFEMMEHLQRILQIKKQQAELQQAAAMASELNQQKEHEELGVKFTSMKEENGSAKAEEQKSFPPPPPLCRTPEKEMNFGVKNSSPEDLKREEELVDDEMKEEVKSDSDSEKPTVQQQQQLNIADLVKHLEESRMAIMKKLSDSISNNNPTETVKLLKESPRDQDTLLQLFRRQQQQATTTSVESTVSPSDNVNNFISASSSSEKDAMTTGNYDGGEGEESICSEGADQDSQDGMAVGASSNASTLINTSGLSDQAVGQSPVMGGHQGDERKVRVRTLISEEQLAILKAYYLANPRPKREELERIASKIGHPFKVVKVWFQNSRARDRREGKPPMTQAGQGGEGPTANFSLLSQMMNANSQVPAGAAAFPFLNNGGVMPNIFSPLNLLPGAGRTQVNGLASAALPTSSASDINCERNAKSPSSSVDSDSNGGGGGPNGEQPLDLSAKGSSPSVSPLSSQADNCVQALSPSPLLQQQNAAGRFSPLHLKYPAAFPFGPQALSAAFPSLKNNVYPFEEDVDVTSEEDGLFSCNRCDKTFAKRSSLTRHKYEHSGNAQLLKYNTSLQSKYRLLTNMTFHLLQIKDPTHAQCATRLSSTSTI